jgi:hypothetical protein
MEHLFDFLTGVVRLNEDAPDEWRHEEILPFWSDPNDERWGGRLCRYLYHESLHFWQLLSSGYLAHLVFLEWGRLELYERTREVLPVDELVASHRVRPSGQPFSPSELMECWARYWDVHTRGAATIVDEEGIPIDPNIGPLSVPVPGSYRGGRYTEAAYDLVMQSGPDCKVYAAPYRWLLDRVQGHSRTAAVLFPFLVHAAFGTRDPVRMFRDLVEVAIGSETISNCVARGGLINLDWLTLRPVLRSEVVVPVMRHTLSTFTSGFDVIRKGLPSHPVLSQYPHMYVPNGFTRLNDPSPVGEGLDERTEANLLVGAVLSDERAPLMMPGQAYYRLLLGHLVPPPAIHFRNFSWYARRWWLSQPRKPNAGTGLEEEVSDRTFESGVSEVEARVRRFRAAEKAVSLGLPAEAFQV